MELMRKGSSALALVAIAAFSCPVSASAQDRIEPLDQFFASAGLYRSGNSLDTKWNSSSGIPGSHLNFQNDLGFEKDKSAFFYEIGGTLAERHQIKLFGYSYDSDASRTLDRTYTVDGDTYTTGADFDGSLDVKLNGFAYTWFFQQTHVNAFGVGIGIVRYDVSASLIASEIEAGGGQSGAAAVMNDFSEAAPAPLLRAAYIHSLSAHFRLGVDAAYVKKGGGRISGEAIDASVRLDYFPWQHAGLSLRYNYNDLSLDLKRSSINGSIDLRNRGPQILATLRF